MRGGSHGHGIFARGAQADLGAMGRGLRVHVISPPFINESAAKMGMPQAGQMSAADNAKVYADVVAGRRKDTVVFPVPV